MRTSSSSSAALLVAAIFLASCSTGLPASSVAVVDGVEIPRDQLESAVTQITGMVGSVEGGPQREAAVAPLQRDLLSTFIQAAIVQNLAAERGITVDHDLIEQQLEVERDEYGGEAGFEEVLLNSQLTLAVYRDVLLPAQQQVEALRGQVLAELPDVEVRHVRHILVADEADARQIVDLIADGGDFAEFAAERSSDVNSRDSGGELGPAPRGRYPVVFDEAVWSASLDEVVGPIETDSGFHVLEVTAEETLPAVDLAPDTQTRALEAQMTELMVGAFEDAQVRIASGFGVWDGGTGTVVDRSPVGSGG